MTAVIAGELTADGSTIILVVSGDDWELDQAAARLRRLTPAPGKVEEGGRAVAVSFPATWPAVVQLGYSFNGFPGYSWQPGPRLTEWTVAETIRRTSPPDLNGHDPGWPPWLKPRDYQLDGAARIASGGKFLLLDEMGTGKTATTILGLDQRRARGHSVFPLVIVVPSWDVADAWAREIALWAPHWPAPQLHGGTGRARDISRRNRRDHEQDVLVTTYATARRDAGERGPLVRLRPAAVVADEVHEIRNPDALQTRAVQRIARHAEVFVGLSGTPIAKNTGDIYPALKAMDPLSWPSRDRMKDRYLATVLDGYDEAVTGLDPAAEPEFRAVLAGQMRRVAKADVLSELPPKIFSVRRPRIPEEWRHAYDTMEEDWLAVLPDGGELPVMDTLSRLTRLSQLASSAADVTMTMVYDEKLGIELPHYTVTLKPPSWKAASLMEIIAERDGQPTVAFMVSRQLAMITGQYYCEPAGLKVGYVVGTGSGITRGTRKRAIEAFQDGKLDVIICTAGAGSLGITLTRSNACVLLQRPWPLDKAVQPEDRVHRLGAEGWDHVDIIDIVAEDTVDERVREVLRVKGGQFGEFVRDPRVIRGLLGGRK